MIRRLITVPPRMAAHAQAAGERVPSWLRRLRGEGAAQAFIGADPAGQRLGSGGGTVHVLHQAWLADVAAGRAGALGPWLAGGQKLVLHAGGESRRLPAYAAIGKAFMPLPAVDGLSPRLPDQVLADFQLPAYEETLAEAGPRAAALVTSGDVWLDFDATEVPAVGADVCGIGMRVAPEVAQHFGVFFVERTPRAPRAGERPIAFFRQKPPPAEIVRHLDRHEAFVDTGMWLLSAEALGVLFRRCGWDEGAGRFGGPNGRPRHLDLYTEVGSALGTGAEAPRALRAAGFGRLTSSVVPLETARFYHLGSSRQLLEAMHQVQWRSLTPRRSFRVGVVAGAVEPAQRDPTWLEGAAAGGAAPLVLEGFNVVTGLPPGATVTRLGSGACLDVAPVGDGAFVVRPYHIDDPSRGAPRASTLCGQPAAGWLSRRGLSAPARHDVFDLPLYPVLPAVEITQELVDWFFDASPSAEVTARLAGARRLAGSAIPAAVDLRLHFDLRRRALEESLRAAFEACAATGVDAVMEQDFAALLAFCKAEAPGLGRWLVRQAGRLMAALTRPEHQSRLAMLLAELTRGETASGWAKDGFARLQAAMVSSTQLAKASPRLALKEDSIVWDGARCGSTSPAAGPTRRPTAWRRAGRC